MRRYRYPSMQKQLSKCEECLHDVMRRLQLVWDNFPHAYFSKMLTFLVESHQQSMSLVEPESKLT